MIVVLMLESPAKNQALLSLFGLIASLTAVVGLAKVTSPLVQGFVDDRGLPKMVIAISIALVVLLPESISAIKAARYGRTQTSLHTHCGYGQSIPAAGGYSPQYLWCFPVLCNPSVASAQELLYLVSLSPKFGRRFD